ncbi:beta-N-acetylglucosaminidase [Solihabitans fulvus]|uniref:Beta-N-acetylglucosaminidase n=1 Tax=Solihabitans fulvus TaxID=1892852 RepID=A0A5B2XGG1_9PSEU|nr:beta-N-acetylglucosaminidase domain-containing protein [Solihabitans fulvus]KAA2262443.1 beta-N-acetylglucosaminidase [Solihabitans fulvus]
MRAPRGRSAWRVGVACLTVLALAGAAGSAVGVNTAPTADAATLPSITPRPQQLVGNGFGLTVPSKARVLAADEVDGPTRDLVTSVLRGAGATDVTVGPLGGPSGDAAGLTVLVGPLADPAVAAALRAATDRKPPTLPAEGYALASRAASGGGTVVLAGADRDGDYYAAQTLRQIVRGDTVAGVSIVDYPTSSVRGVIEGFYGTPWTQAARLDQLAFYGSVKLNTFVYSPKDDPYLRERWRDPYPADQLDQLRELVDHAVANHVRLDYALSPGVSICYADPDDVRAVEAKFQSLYDIGVRGFLLPLDDIDYSRWNCAADRAKYGNTPTQQTAARAQIDMLNQVQHDFVEQRADLRPLAMVPTEYYELKDSPYKKEIRDSLDPAVKVMWTGPEVIPATITVADARKAERTWGRKGYLWDNYPVNDFDSTGRLLLGPYSGRQEGLPGAVSGIVLNPMVQASASKVAILGGADFMWHDKGYRPERTTVAAADLLAGGDQDTARALLAFFDVEHYAPTSDQPPKVAQPQAPQLAKRLAAFTSAWSRGDRAAALRDLRSQAQLLADAPDRIRSGVTDREFVAECEPWLRALSLWGQAFLATVDGLDARVSGDEDAAGQHFADAATLTEQAAAAHARPVPLPTDGPIRVADGVLDTFLQRAVDLH